MLKLSAVIGSMAFFTSSWLSGTTLPRLTHSSVDYLLMPLLGYITLVIAAQLAARIIKEPT